MPTVYSAAFFFRGSLLPNRKT